MIKVDNNFIFLETKNTLLIFEIKDYCYEYGVSRGDKIIVQRYYGLKKDFNSLKNSKALLCPHGSCQDYNFDFNISSSFGDGNNSEFSLLILNSDNTFVNRFFYKDFSIVKEKVMDGPRTRNVKETIDIVTYDKVANLELHHYYSICDDSDVIVSKKELVNKGEKSCNVKRLMSLQLPIDSKKLKIYTYDGEWLNERQRHEVTLNSGVFINQSMAGSSSHKHNPFIQIINLNNNNHYAFNLIYSGNHKEMVEINPSGHSDVFVGINDFAFDYLLEAHKSFITPEAVMLVAPSQDEITYEMHNFVMNHIINPSFKNKERPIIFNNWEGTGMNIDESSILEMTKIASEIGIEQVVMDDGWFNNRNNEKAGLGDWFADTKKFPRGLGKFTDEVRLFGLKFGIWVEPEMISQDTDLYRSHPEYALMVPNYEPLTRRCQLMIDMANPKVVDYLFDSLTKMIDEAKPDYIKWDYNRMIFDTNPNNGIRSGEYLYHFMMGSYSLMERLTNKYPNILFESCASGGGRYDLGILYYMPQTWGSDNSNSFSRVGISCGTFVGYPQSTFGAHVSRDGSALNRISSLEDRFNINAFGAFGYEFDLRTFDKDELNIMHKQIDFYKKHRQLLQFGHLYIVDDYFDDARYYSVNVVNDDKSSSILLAVETKDNLPSKKWRFKGLNPDYNYELDIREQYNLPKTNPFVMNGKELMEEGIDLGSLNKISDKSDYPNGIYSRLVIAKRVK